MADADIFGQFTQGFQSMGAGAYTAIIYGGLALTLIGLVIFFIWWFSHNRKVLINYETKGGIKFYREDWARLKREKGADYWKLRGLRKKWLSPPGEVVRISKKGKFVAECIYREADDLPTWVNMTFDPDKIYNSNGS